MKKKIIIWVAIAFLLVSWAGIAYTDYADVAISFDKPQFCISTMTADDGGSGKYFGLGYSFDIEGKSAVLVISGIGKVSAALTTQLLIDKYSPEYIFNFGTCGGLNNNVKVLNFYLIEKCCQYDFDLTKFSYVGVDVSKYIQNQPGDTLDRISINGNSCHLFKKY